jgi:hypothetical protein
MKNLRTKRKVMHLLENEEVLQKTDRRVSIAVVILWSNN